MARADFSTPRPVRIGTVIVVLLLHIAAILGLMRAFAPELSASVVRNVTSAFIVTVPSPTPAPPAVRERAAPQKEGAAAAPGKKATPRKASAPVPKIALSGLRAPQVSATGNENSSGARDSGDGTGAAGQGTGTGGGGSGSGQGGEGGGTKAEKIAGDINSARDYPRSGRDLRLGDHVIIALTVGIDGRARDCRVVRPSRDPQADKVTCDLAMKRFRFRPATDVAGKPVESVYGWKQRWFTKNGE